MHQKSCSKIEIESRYVTNDYLKSKHLRFRRLSMSLLNRHHMPINYRHLIREEFGVMSVMQFHSKDLIYIYIYYIHICNL